MVISWLTFNGKWNVTEELKVHPRIGHEGPEAE